MTPLERIMKTAEAAIKSAVRAERERCAGLVLEAARERQATGDPEGEGILLDLYRLVRSGE